MKFQSILSTFFLVCLVTFTANAQNAVVIKSFTQTTDHIPGNDRRNDLNGTPCALVKVQVVDDIERIEGNRIGDIVKYGVEKWVYMCAGSRNMRIHLKNHLPVKVMFQDYHINGLESNRVYELVIEIPDASLPSSANERVQAKVSPKSAEPVEPKETQEVEMLEVQKTEKPILKNKSQSVYQKVKEKKRRLPANYEKTVVFGVRAGVNFASLGLDSDADGKCSMVTSFHMGVNVDVNLINQLHLNTSLLFSQKGYKYEHNWDYERQETAKAQFIMLPIQLSYRIGLLQINAGPYIEYGLGGGIEYGQRGWSHDTFDYYDALNYGVTAGVGINLSKQFYLGVNYEMGFSDYANRNIAISLGYNF